MGEVLTQPMVYQDVGQISLDDQLAVGEVCRAAELVTGWHVLARRILEMTEPFDESLKAARRRWRFMIVFYAHNGYCVHASGSSIAAAVESMQWMVEEAERQGAAEQSP